MKKRLIKIFMSLILFIIALIIPFSNQWINKTILLISYLLVGYEIIKKAFRNIFRGKIFDENFLMTIATLGALGINQIPEAVGVMLFYQIGELFQDYAVDKSRKSISSLMEIRPDYANIKNENEIKRIDPDEVKVGDQIIVKPGEKIPLDGIVVDGNSMIDTSNLTGESIPRTVKIGDEVLSGCINQNGLLTIKVTKEYSESTVSKILELVENASNKKSKSENFISKFAKYYTPIVVLIAVILIIIPPILTGKETFSEWLYRALSFLVVSCPCALVISIPLGFFGGIGGASKLGILIKGSNYLEALADTEMIVFDKTGTLTKGIFKVQKIFSINIDQEELLKLVAYSENYSTHPVAISIKNLYGKEIDTSLILDHQEIFGYGVMANIEGKQILVGNDKLMTKYNINYKNNDENGTVIYVAVDKEYAGYIVISDELKGDATDTIRELKRKGIKRIAMLTGDKVEVANYFGKILEINEVYSELLPNDKVKKMEEFIEKKSKKGAIAFVGDGINDAPVLTLSDIGIAMGGLGSDAAIEAADIVLMTDEPSKIVNCINISKKTMKIVRENIVFAITIKILVLIMSAFGYSNMWEAVFADVGVSVLAILNSLRMLKVKNKYI